MEPEYEAASDWLVPHSHTIPTAGEIRDGKVRAVGCRVWWYRVQGIGCRVYGVGHLGVLTSTAAERRTHNLIDVTDSTDDD
jgi:hypothetical protein